LHFYFNVVELLLILNYGGNTMAHVISSECVSCGACIGECPVDAITAGDDQYNINADTCIDCGACVSACPTDSISG